MAAIVPKIKNALVSGQAFGIDTKPFAKGSAKCLKMTASFFAAVAIFFKLLNDKTYRQPTPYSLNGCKFGFQM